MNKYKHVSLEERVEIYSLLKLNTKISQIALKLGRNKGTISREIERNSQGFYKGYSPIHAQNKSEFRAKIQREKAPLKKPKTFFYVRAKLKEYWSPETIAGRLRIEYPNNKEYWITPESIYRYIYGKGKRLKLYEYLTVARKKRRHKTGRKVFKQSKIPNAVSIDFRPIEANNRLSFGHFETDLMEGVKHSGAVVSALNERMSRYVKLTKIPDKRSLTKVKYLTRDLREFEKCDIKSVTADNGSENTNHKEISDTFNSKFYFCHPYHSWEKGGVENAIKRVRRFIPKGTDLNKVSSKYIKALESYMNNKPMKCLNYL